MVGQIQLLYPLWWIIAHDRWICKNSIILFYLLVENALGNTPLIRDFFILRPTFAIQTKLVAEFFLFENFSLTSCNVQMAEATCIAFMTIMVLVQTSYVG